MPSRYNPDKHHRRSIRLKGYDYTTAGAYFITLCTHQRECLFGAIEHGEMKLSLFGEVVRSKWMHLPNHHDRLHLDEFVVMPNHMHGIVWLGSIGGRGEAFAPEITAEAEDINANASPLHALRPYMDIVLMERDQDQLGRSSKISNRFPLVASIKFVSRQEFLCGSAIIMNTSSGTIAPYSTSDNTSKTIHCHGRKTNCILTLLGSYAIKGDLLLIYYFLETDTEYLLTRYMGFDRWDRLLIFMFQGLKLGIPPKTSEISLLRRARITASPLRKCSQIL